MLLLTPLPGLPSAVLCLCLALHFELNNHTCGLAHTQESFFPQGATPEGLCHHGLQLQSDVVPPAEHDSEGLKRASATC